ncbi:isochorismate synthase MenF [Streptomyces sp. AP-93]|uniref:isochorismate synthase n=1 Tax=Streptomyces sp. AP-93 TaxID=2929048 RepID=UPI001FAF4F95|nr:isochorismate synthase [Streptomyces sp. AP-93]MCJ0874997.1 isochorismate synthase [Streptomyces sp. AP-93]
MSSSTPLVVTTLRIPDPGPLATLPPGPSSTLWLHRGDGLAAWGEAARLETAGPDRFDEADRLWREWTAAAVIRDEVRRPGTGPVAFGSFTFATAGTSALVVPRVLVGRRDGVSWMTTVGTPPSPLPRQEPAPMPRAIWQRDTAARPHWQHAVDEAVRRIRDGEAHKVVLARQAVGELSHAADFRTLTSALSHRNPDCFTFAVDGLTGATPELLVRRTGRQITSIALAGTSWPGGTSPIGTAKNAEEHGYAATSVTDTLRPLCSELHACDQPELLHLPHLTHLATRITGTLNEDVSSLGLAGALHPTAAVGGTPTDRALDLIQILENTDRGRYAAPVGWQDAHGDGEWCIALRCAAIKGNRLQLYAGCGIVADSEPEAEWQETEVKLTAMRSLFEELVPALR